MEETKENKDFKHIVRIANTDLDGSVQIGNALRKIKGINFMFSNFICNTTKIDKKRKTGELNETEVKVINETIKDPKKAGAPTWMFNRRRDPLTGVDHHIITADLTFTKDTDIKTLKKIKSYRGVRHMLNQPVRGQKTKSNFRENKGKVHLGVKKKPGAKSGRP